MIQLLIEHIGTILIGLGLLAVVTGVVRKMRRDKKKGGCAGCAGCSGDCGSCRYFSDSQEKD